MFERNTKRNRIIKAALRLVEGERWRRVGLSDIAREAGLPLADVQDQFRTKTDILQAFIEAVDHEMLTRASVPDADAPARDRVFEVVMTRLDVLKPYKNALQGLYADYRRAPPDPGTARLLCASMNSHKWMLNAAGIPAEGTRGGMRVSGLMCVYSRVLPTWLKDEDPDQTKTMAVLDRELRKGERWLQCFDALCGDLGRLACCFVPRRRRRGGPGAAQTPPPTEEPPSAAEQPSAG